MTKAEGSVFAQRIVVALAASLFIGSLLACPAEDNGNSNAATEAGDSTAATDVASGADAESGDPAACPNGNFGLGTDGQNNPLMDSWGSPCTQDSDCVPALGEGAICQKLAVVYELPGGYCSRPCTLPDNATRVVDNAPDCDPGGGIACIGLKGFFESCAPLCTDDMQCNREGYFCRQMPMIAEEGDAKACLMPDCCDGTCE